MHVANPRGQQLGRQGLAVELWVVSRPGDTAYIYDSFDAMCPKNFEEFWPCARRMSNRQDNRRFRRFHIKSSPREFADGLEKMEVDALA